MTPDSGSGAPQRIKVMINTSQGIAYGYFISKDPEFPYFGTHTTSTTYTENGSIFEFIDENKYPIEINGSLRTAYEMPTKDMLKLFQAEWVKLRSFYCETPDWLKIKLSREPISFNLTVVKNKKYLSDQKRPLSRSGYIPWRKRKIM